MAERFADGQATAQELEAAKGSADNNAVEEDGQHQQAELASWLPRSPEDDELFLRELDYRRDRLHAAMLAHTSTFPDEWLERQELPAVGPWKNTAGLVRCLSGNSFRPVSLAPAWLTPAVLKLAQAAYDNRLLPSGLLDNGGLAILADALEEAGCDNPDILSHLRGPGPHVRGCWAIDLLLGKK